MRAVKGNLGHSSEEKHYELNYPRLVASLVSPFRLSRFTVIARSHPNMQGKIKLRPSSLTSENSECLHFLLD
jgi:hypothetical protein